MDLNEIRTFVEIVKNQSFSKAAHVLGTPKSTLSRQLDRLEKRLGQTLVLRTTRKLTLTKAGEDFYFACRKSMDDLLEAENKLHQDLNEPSGLVRFTAPSESGVTFLPKIIVDFMESYPKIKIEMIFTDRVVNLIEEKFDVALRSGKIIDPNLIAKKIAIENFICVASPGYLKKYGLPNDFESLKKHRCLVFSSRKDPLVWKFQRIKSEASLAEQAAKNKTHSKKTVSSTSDSIEVKVPDHYQISSINTVKHVCIADGGMAYLPRIHVEDSLMAGELQNIFPEWQGPTGAHHICFPLLRNQPLRTRLFIDFLFHRLEAT